MNIPVRTWAVSALHVSRVHTEPVQNVKLEVVWTSLVGHTPSLALVELVAQLGVGLLDKIVGATNGAVREGVVTLPGKENISLAGTCYRFQSLTWCLLTSPDSDREREKNQILKTAKSTYRVSICTNLLC